jgi:hypothetical protein
MAESIPIRVSAWLAETARKAAHLQDRSLTEQVEHWARLGQVVESAILTSTSAQLKLLSHDPALADALNFADTPAGRKRAARSIARKNPLRYGTTAGEPSRIVHVGSRRHR